MNKRAFIAGIVMLVCICAYPIAAQSLWMQQEIAELDGFSEMGDTVMLKFKDAVTGKAVRGLELHILNQSYRGDDDGIVVFPKNLIETITDEDVAFTATANGYLELRDVLKIQLGSVIFKRFLMTAGMEPHQGRFILEWESRPTDLDLHLTGPGFHVSYRNMKSVPGKARLDRDARQGYGPETITIDKIDGTGRYEVFIDNYSKETPMRNVKITVYLDNELQKVLYYPSIPPMSLTVLRIENGRITYYQ